MRNTLKPKHDQLFRKALENPMVAQELLEAHLPKEVLAMIDKSTLRLEKESFVEPELSHSIADVLFSAKFNGKEGYIQILLEHQSTVDHLMAFRLFKYMLNICDRHLQTNHRAKQLPLVYPLVIYNGKRPYNAPLNIWDLFSDSVIAKRFWVENHKVVDMSKIPDEELVQRMWSGILELFLKHMHERNLIKQWEEIESMLPRLITVKEGRGYIEIMLYYSLTHMPENDRVKLKNILTNSIQEEGEKLMMTIAESLWQDGMLAGRQLGEVIGEARGEASGERRRAEEIANDLLARGFDSDFVLSVTGVDTILKASNN